MRADVARAGGVQQEYLPHHQPAAPLAQRSVQGGTSFVALPAACISVMYGLPGRIRKTLRHGPDPRSWHLPAPLARLPPQSVRPLLHTCSHVGDYRHHVERSKDERLDRKDGTGRG